jgi:hypothetical protein
VSTLWHGGSYHALMMHRRRRPQVVEVSTGLGLRLGG